ncbi:hypothetical protein CMI47_03500 [Candidatus Pacearchaeota archaeon]|nr:hypothetical protein [Candidatus Pacearchaeota archaeon]|tara:strand:- start:139 stop:456 length:318 start_codon:yes stop_codon:yes gene_type:complete
MEVYTGKITALEEDGKRMVIEVPVEKNLVTMSLPYDRYATKFSGWARANPYGNDLINKPINVPNSAIVAARGKVERAKSADDSAMEVLSEAIESNGDTGELELAP